MDMAGRVRRTAIRLARITNVTAVSFGLMEGAWTALREADLSFTGDYRGIVELYCGECEWMTVIRLRALFDRDGDSYQRVCRRLQDLEVVDVLVRLVCDDQPAITEEHVRSSFNEFIRLHEKARNRDLRSRLVHSYDIGLADPIAWLDEQPSRDELRDLVRLARDLASCLEPLTESDVASWPEDEIRDHTQRAARIWRAAEPELGF